jgi:hypothetical protein
MLILRESNGRDCAILACQRIPLPSGKIFSIQIDTPFGTVTRGFYSVRKQIASVKAPIALVPDYCGESGGLASTVGRPATMPVSCQLPLGRIGFSYNCLTCLRDGL